MFLNKRFLQSFFLIPFVFPSFIFSLFSFSTISYAEKSIVIERIVAVVNEEIILQSEWLKRLEIAKQQLKAMLTEEEKEKKLKELKRKVLDEMINELLIDQQARKLQISVSEEELKRAIEDTRRRYNLTEEQFAEALKQQNYTMESYKEMVRRQLRKLKLIQRELRGKVQISEQDIRGFYNRVTNSMEEGPTEYRIAHIVFLVKKGASKKEIADTKREITNVLNLLKQRPSEFARLAKRFSQDSSSSEQGGDMGYMKAEDLHPSLVKVIKKMKVGEIYPNVVRSPMGFHILYLKNKRRSGILDYKEAAKNIRRKLQQQAFARAFVHYVQKLRKNAVIDIRL